MNSWTNFKYFIFRIFNTTYGLTGENAPKNPELGKEYTSRYSITYRYVGNDRYFMVV